MNKIITRRDLLKFAGGSAVGVLLTPIPWKLLDDSAIWSQNWSLIPKLGHGPITVKYSACTLCPAGCAVKARCINGLPFGLSGVANHPLGHGYLCARGLAAHHLPFHPLRMTIPHRFSSKKDDAILTPVTLEQAVNDISSAASSSDGSVVVLDRLPGRAMSEFYSAFAESIPKGIHASITNGEDATLAAIAGMTKKKNTVYGFDFDAAEIIVSFGTPLLEGFGDPGHLRELHASRRTRGVTFVQIESVQSATALQADVWIPLRPGSERTLALAIANVIISEQLMPARAMSSIVDLSSLRRAVQGFTPERTGSITGIAPQKVRDLARGLASARSSVILSGSDPGGGPLGKETDNAIAALNVLLGNVGTNRTVVPRSVPVTARPVDWSSLPDRSVSILFLDGAENGYAYPWELIEKKLVPEKNIVVSLSPFAGENAAHADYIIPTTTYFESVVDLPATTSAPFDLLTIAPPLFQRPEGSIETDAFLARMAKETGSSLELPRTEDILKERIQDLHRRGKGTVFSFADASNTPVSQFSGPDELLAKLMEGGTWFGEKEAHREHPTFTVNIDASLPSAPNGTLFLIPTGRKGEVSSTSVAPVLSKMFQETELHYNGNTVIMNPQTMAAYGLEDGSAALLSTKKGCLPVSVRPGNQIPPSILNAVVGPLRNRSAAEEYLSPSTILSLCDIAADGSWRLTEASISPTEHS